MRRLLLVLLLVCALGLQVLGALHGIAHGGHARAPHAALADAAPQAAAQAPALSPASDPAPAPSWLAALFADHDGPQDCRLLDGLGQQTPVLWLLPLLLAVRLPSRCAQRLRAGAFVARWAALFDARGPPLSR